MGSEKLESKGRATGPCSITFFNLPLLISPLQADLAVPKEVWSISETYLVLKRSSENFPPVNGRVKSHIRERSGVAK